MIDADCSRCRLMFLSGYEDEDGENKTQFLITPLLFSP